MSTKGTNIGDKMTGQTPVGSLVQAVASTGENVMMRVIKFDRGGCVLRMGDGTEFIEMESNYADNVVVELPPDPVEVVRKLVEAGSKAARGRWGLSRKDFPDDINFQAGPLYYVGRYEDPVLFREFALSANEIPTDVQDEEFIVAAANARPAISSLLSEVEALRKIVARLPKDEHGATIQTGDRVQHPMLNDPRYVQAYQKIKGKWWLNVCNVAIVTHNDPDEDFSMVRADECQVIQGGSDAE